MSTSTKLVDLINPLCSALVEQCQALYDGIMQECSESTFTDRARVIATSCLQAVNAISSYLESRTQEVREKTELQENFIVDYKEKLRFSVLNLVKYAKRLFANRMDYMTQMDLKNSKEEVLSYVNQLIEASINLDQVDEIDDNSTSPSTDVQDLSSQEADIIAESVSEYSTLLKDSLAKMAAAIPSQDETEFIMALDTIDSCTKGLYESLKDVKSAEKNVHSFYDVINGFKTSAQAFYQDPISVVYSKKYDDAQKQVGTELKQLIFMVAQRSKLVGRSLSRGLSQRRLTRKLISPKNADDPPVSPKSSESTDVEVVFPETTEKRRNRTKFVTSRRMMSPSDESKNISHEEDIPKELSSPKKTRRKKNAEDSEDKKSKRSKDSKKTILTNVETSSISPKEASPLKTRLEDSSDHNSLEESGSESFQAKTSIDRKDICNRIIQIMADEFPLMRKEWENASAQTRLNVEGKINSELAVYQITLLQSMNQEPSLSKTPSKSKESPEVKKKVKKETVRQKNKDSNRRGIMPIFKLFGSDSDVSRKEKKDKDKETHIEEELKRIASMKTTSDIGNMTVRIKGLKLGDDENVAEVDNLQTQSFSDLILKFLTVANTASHEISNYKSSLRQDLHGHYKGIHSHFASILNHAKKIVEDSQKESLVALLVRLGDELSQPFEGKVDEIDSRLLDCPNRINTVVKNVERSVYRSCSQLYFGTSQIMTNINNLSKQNGERERESIVFHLLTLVLSNLSSMSNIVNDLETLHYLSIASSQINLRPSTIPSLKDTNPQGSLHYQPLTEEELTNPYKPGDLNQLIMRLVNIESDCYMKVFVDSYASFTTSAVVIEKLYELSTTTDLKDQRIPILGKVAVALLSIVRECYFEFDTATTKKAKELMGELAKSVEIGQTVHKIVKLFSELERKKMGSFIVEVPTELIVHPDITPYTILLEYSPELIAEQLTYIEFDLYKSIQSAELKNQSWNKDKRKCMARNVISLIQRTNRLSFWIASSILLQTKLKDRARAVIKAIQIARSLKDMCNYNTLMGVIAGLNMSCISRLKQTFNSVGKKYVESLAALQRIVDPQSSFKTLREAIKVGGPNQIPYIGTVLGDLTFIEDGNPNHITFNGEELINMEKWNLVSTSIQNLRMYQSGNYKIHIRDPPYTFLYELPAASESILYSLSLEREPRTN